MYYDDENEEDIEEYEEGAEEQRQEIADRRELNSLRSKAGKSSGGVTGGIKTKATGAVKGAVKGVARGIGAGLKKVVVVLISHPIALAIIAGLIFLVIIYFVITDKLSSSVGKSVDNYIGSISDSMDDAAKEAYDKNSSLLLLKVSEINEMYKQYIEDKSIPNDLKTILKTLKGTNGVQGEANYEYIKPFKPEDVLKKAKELTDKFAKEKYVFGIPKFIPANEKGNTSGNEIGSDGKVIGLNAKCMSSNAFISWVLHELGLTDQPYAGLTIQGNANTEGQGLEWFCKKNGFKKINSKDELNGGDIVFLGTLGTNAVTHVYIFDSWKSSDKTECKAYDCGSKEWIQSGNQPITRKCISDGKQFLFAYRPEVTKKGNGVK
ncbi:MAG: hypothetical protein PHP54_01995 [Clostridia bacterium]|nr:hypothetical protein [Clostridia bacterium]